MGKSSGNHQGIMGESWGIMKESAVDYYIIWRMSGAASGAYYQQWIAIRGAACICDFIAKMPLANFET